MAIACLRLFTVPPRPPFPLLSVPRFRRRIALATRLLAARPYFRLPDSLADFFLVAMMPPSVSRLSNTLTGSVQTRCREEKITKNSGQLPARS